MKDNLARLVLIVSAALVLTPVVYMLGTAFKVDQDIFSNPINPIPLHATLTNFGDVARKLDLARMLFVSLAFALGVTLGQVAIAIPAAYMFARGGFFGCEALFAIALGTLPIPFVVTYIPNYLLLAEHNALNTLLGLIAPQIASAYGIFLLRQHFRAFPRSVLEAARIDGAGTAQTLLRIVIPSNWPVLIALSVYIFVNTWNQYIWPLLVASDPKLFTLTVGVQNFANGEGGSRWGALMAAATLATIPTAVAFLLVRKQILNTLLEGAVKG